MFTRTRGTGLLGIVIAALTVTPVALAAASPPGDIPDNQAFVLYKGHGYSLRTPEGWARSNASGSVTFADKYNAIRVDAPRARAAAPTVTSVRSHELASLRGSTKGFVLSKVVAVSRPAGAGVLVTYRALSAPSAVTGKAVQDDVERYELWRAGKLVVVTVQAPHGSDNVDAWRLVTSSVRWTP